MARALVRKARPQADRPFAHERDQGGSERVGFRGGKRRLLVLKKGKEEVRVGKRRWGILGALEQQPGASEEVHR